MSKDRSAQYLEALAGPAQQRGLSEGDAFRVGSDAADLLARFGDHAATRELLTSGWQAGSLKTMGGQPMREHAPLDGVLQVADGVCGEFFPDAWGTYVASDRDRHVRLLQEEYAHLASVPLSSHVDRVEQIKDALRQLGAEPDHDLTDHYRQNPH